MPSDTRLSPAKTASKPTEKPIIEKTIEKPILPKELIEEPKHLMFEPAPKPVSLTGLNIIKKLEDSLEALKQANEHKKPHRDHGI